jgi:hypothetical protein
MFKIALTLLNKIKKTLRRVKKFKLPKLKMTLSLKRNIRRIGKTIRRIGRKTNGKEKTKIMPVKRSKVRLMVKKNGKKKANGKEKKVNGREKEKEKINKMKKEANGRTRIKNNGKKVSKKIKKIEKLNNLNKKR